jgi:hypothetical protein
MLLPVFLLMIHVAVEVLLATTASARRGCLTVRAEFSSHEYGKVSKRMRWRMCRNDPAVKASYASPPYLVTWPDHVENSSDSHETNRHKDMFTSAALEPNVSFYREVSAAAPHMRKLALRVRPSVPFG